MKQTLVYFSFLFPTDGAIGAVLVGGVAVAAAGALAMMLGKRK